jgi:small basic protein
MNKITLKSLQKELEQLKSVRATKGVTKISSAPAKAPKGSVETHKSSVAHDIKNSYIQNLHMKSSMFVLWLLSWALLFINKVPMLKYIFSFLSMYYGRTTIWQNLVKVRKIFIVFNAIIGVWMVYKSLDFGIDNLLAGFIGMGNTYLEIFSSLTKRLFNWFFELFDYKVVPNVPGTKPSIPKPHPSGIYYPPGLDRAWKMTLPDLTKLPTPGDLFGNQGININIHTLVQRSRNLGLDVD